MKNGKIIFFGIAIALVFASCMTYPKVDFGYPQTGNSSNASIVIKDYETKGIIFVKSSETIDGNGNHTGSKITYEMLLREAQKLGADDVINIRIDVNEILEFDLLGTPRTIYNYTATALAIKYTAAIVSNSRNINFENNSNTLNNTNNAIAQDQIKKSSSFRQSANIKNNWLSLGATIGGGGIRYERMLNSNLSVGGHVYYQLAGVYGGDHADMGGFNGDLGFEAVARFYPIGKVLYIGTGLGLHRYGVHRYHEPSLWVGGGYYGGYYIYDEITGFGVTPELGVKIHFGKEGGFFIDCAYKNPLLFSDYGFHFNTVAQINFGWAF